MSHECATLSRDKVADAATVELQLCFMFKKGFFHVFMFYVSLLIVRLCLMSDIVFYLFIGRLHCIDLFSCIAASLLHRLTYLLTYLLSCTLNGSSQHIDVAQVSAVADAYH